MRVRLLSSADVGGHLEREFKFRIPSEEAFQALLARLGGAASPPVLQVNHFFDTAAGALRRSRLALRLRDEQGAFTLALKGPSLGTRPSLASRPEEELPLDERTARSLLAGERSPLEILRGRRLAGSALARAALELAGPEPLAHIGALENERVRVGPLRFPPGSDGPLLVFELDRTRFPGGRLERELEVELPEGTEPAELERALGELFSSLGVPLEPVPSKAARLFDILARSSAGGEAAGTHS